MVDLVRTVRTVPAFKADRVVRFLQVFLGVPERRLTCACRYCVLPI